MDEYVLLYNDFGRRVFSKVFGRDYPNAQVLWRHSSVLHARSYEPVVESPPNVEVLSARRASWLVPDLPS